MGTILILIDDRIKVKRVVKCKLTFDRKFKVCIRVLIERTFKLLNLTITHDVYFAMWVWWSKTNMLNLRVCFYYTFKHKQWRWAGFSHCIYMKNISVGMTHTAQYKNFLSICLL